MRFLLLGPLQIATGEGETGDARTIPGALRRTLLAMLVLHHDTPVAADTLAEALWGTHAPTTSLYNQITRLRQSLGAHADRIRAVAPGHYQIHLEPGELDLDTFTGLCITARRAEHAQRWTEAADTYAAALELWRGEPLADVSALRGHPAVERLREEHLHALHGRIKADAQLGRHLDVIGELRTLVKEHPLHEDFRSQLMLALHRSGRQAEALDVYRTLRRIVIDELGVEPGAAIRDLHSRILRSDPALEAHKREPPAAAARQLPADTRMFAGREAELEKLVGATTDAGSGTVVISAINGMGGVGKTALAVRAAHRLGGRFPDGQLFIDLHGYSADLEPVTPPDALAYLLRSLGVPPREIPNDLGERAALYRSRLAGTRTLIVLDNAVDADQARPLLPGAPGCLVLITSRNRLAGLDDAQVLALDVLEPAEAVALLRDIAGPDRIPHDARAAELAELCGRIPLAVRITGARLRHGSTLTVQDLITELRAEGAGPDRIDDGERSLSRVFDTSLKVLPPEAQRLFRLLGLVPGPDFDAYAAAHLAATDSTAARRLLDTLLDHNLLIQHTPGRYRFHDLLRAHAFATAESDPDGPAALERLLDYYLHAMRAADRLLARQNRPTRAVRATVPEPRVHFDHQDEALRRLRTERENLLAAIAQRDLSPARRAELIGAISAYLIDAGPWSLAAELHRIAIAEARRCGDRLEEANALVELGHITARTGDPDRSERYHESASVIYQELGSELGAANAQFELGLTRYGRGHLTTAAAPTERALAIYEVLGERRSAGQALQRLGCLASLAGSNQSADGLFNRALEILREVGDAFGEAGCLLMLSRVRYALGDFGAVRPMLDRTLQLFRRVGNRQGEANALQEIGRQLLLTGSYDEATAMLEQALTIHRAIGFRMGEGNVYWEFGRIRFARGDLEGAREMHTKALEMFRHIRNIGGEAWALHELARISLAQNDFDAAERSLTQALEFDRRMNGVVEIVEVRNTLAELAALRDGPADALALYTKNLTAAVEVGHPLEQAHALLGLARCEARLGHGGSALRHGREAADLYQRLQSPALTGAREFLKALSPRAGRAGRPSAS
jgi:DNA-binding SARP family transcriptional activator/Tfp pilus assembly protein PilF